MIGAPLDRNSTSFGKRHAYHIIAITVFAVLTVVTLRVFLFDNSLFTYRDLTWSHNIDLMLSNMISTLDLESSRRIVFLGPLLYGSQLLGLTGIDAEKILFFASRLGTGIIAYYAIFKFLEAKVGGDGDSSSRWWWRWSGNAGSDERRRRAIFIVAMLGAFLYSFNPIVTSQLSTTLFFVISYSLLPLIFYYFDKTLTEGKFKNVFITGILISLALAGTTQFLALLPVFLLLPWVLLLCIRSGARKEIRTILSRTSYVFLATLGLSFYWVFISLMIMSEGVVLQPPYILTLDSLRLFSSENSMVNAIRLMGDWWPRVPLIPIIDDNLWTALTFVIPISSVLFLIHTRRSRLGYYIVAFTMISLFAIFLYKGAQPPLQDLYAATYNLPVIGWMFRIPQKIGIILPFFVTMIVSLGMYELLARRNNSKNNNSSSNGNIKIGRILHNAKYLAVGGLVVTASIINWPMFTGDFAGVYESRTASGTGPSPIAPETMEISTSGSMIPVFGESRKYNLLSTLGSFGNSPASSSPSSSATMADKRLGLDSHFSSELANVAVLDDRENLLLHFLFQEGQRGGGGRDTILVKAFDATSRHAPDSVWSRAGSDNPLHGPFNNYLEARHGIANSDHDYGMGLILTWAKDSINLPVSVDRTGQYDMFIRLLKNEAGGQLRVYLDGTLVSQIDTKDRANRFSVLHIDSREIQSGEHTIRLENLSGFNAVNVLALVPSSKIPEADAKLRDYAQSITNLFLFEIERDFRPVEDERGWQNHHPGVLDMSLYMHPDIPGDARLRIDVNRGNSTAWNIISSDYIPVSPGANIKYEFTVHGQDVNGLHSKVYYFDADRKPFHDEFVMGGTSGTFTQNVSRTLPAPEDAAYAKLQFWIRPNPVQESFFLLGNVALFSEDFRSVGVDDEEGVGGEGASAEAEAGAVAAGPTQSRITLNHGSSIGRDIDILKDSQYTLAIKVGFCEDCGSITASIGGVSSPLFSLQAENEGSDWLVFSTFLPAQETELRITSIGRAHIDMIALYSDGDKIGGIDQLFSNPGSVSILEYDKVSPTRYLVTAHSDRPFVLNLLRAYDPLWKAETDDGSSYSPVQLYGQQNSFLIDREGTSHIVIEYQPQQWFHTGGAASLIFFSAGLIYLVLSRSGLRRQFPVFPATKSFLLDAASNVKNTLPSGDAFIRKYEMKMPGGDWIRAISSNYSNVPLILAAVLFAISAYTIGTDADRSNNAAIFGYYLLATGAVLKFIGYVRGKS